MVWHRCDLKQPSLLVRPAAGGKRLPTTGRGKRGSVLNIRRMYSARSGCTRIVRGCEEGYKSIGFVLRNTGKHT